MVARVRNHLNLPPGPRRVEMSRTAQTNGMDGKPDFLTILFRSAA